MQRTAEVDELMGRTSRRPWLGKAERTSGPRFDRSIIETWLPHRDPFLFVDEVTHFDGENRTVVCRYDLARSAEILAGHFPGYPILPGVLQVEAIGQAGLCLLQLLRDGVHDSAEPLFALTHITAARFMRPVLPGQELEIVARVLNDGAFVVVVGQCLQGDKVCSVAAMQGIERGRPANESQ